MISYHLLSDVMSMLLIRYSKFQSVASITLHFPENFGGDITQIHYIGLKGEATQVMSLPYYWFDGCCWSWLLKKRTLLVL
jgi:enoyl reductase-like protein